MASQQKRLISAANSKLGKVDIVAMLRKDEAWALLPPETRQHLYSLLPAARPFEGEFDTDVHPLKDQFKYHIESELRRWQDDLKDGKETKKWRDEAMQAGRDRQAGAFDEYSEARHEEYWGRRKSAVNGRDARRAMNVSPNGALQDSSMANGVDDHPTNNNKLGGESEGLGVGYGDEGDTEYPQSRSPSVFPPNPYTQGKMDGAADDKTPTTKNGGLSEDHMGEKGEEMEKDDTAKADQKVEDENV